MTPRNPGDVCRRIGYPESVTVEQILDDGTCKVFWFDKWNDEQRGTVPTGELSVILSSQWPVPEPAEEKKEEEVRT